MTGLKPAPHLEIGQRINAFVGDEINAAAVTPVAAVGTSTRNIFLAPEAGASGTAVARLNSDRGFIDKLHSLTSNKKPRRSGVFPDADMTPGPLRCARHHVDEQAVFRAFAAEFDTAIGLRE